MTRQTRREILHDLDDFITAIEGEDVSQVRLSFFHRRNGEFVTVQPRLFYPMHDRILIWEGPAEMFYYVQREEMVRFEKRCLQLVEEKLGFEPRRGRWE